MSYPTPGLHHVTAISGPPRDNVAFYRERLGLRLVKQTVNFDDPGTYHLYYGDALGQPGTALTFFPFAEAAAGISGDGEARQLAWRVSCAGLARWQARLDAAGHAVHRTTRFDEDRLVAHDPHGFGFALVGSAPDPTVSPWHDSPVAAADQLGGFDGIDLISRAPEATARVLRDVLGYRLTHTDDHWQRFLAAGQAESRSVLDLRRTASGRRHAPGAGSVHHIAFRATDRAHQQALAEAARALGLTPTPVIDRQYFESVYFREPGGILFEIATDAPGFTVDESAEALGSRLCLPPQHEPRRCAIEAALPSLASASR